jgi:hypothetical protein
MTSQRLAVETILVAALSFLVLFLSTPEPKVSLDSLTAESISQGATVGSGAGPPSSMAGLNHGALWFRFLRATRTLGLDAQGQWVVITILGALASGVVYHLFRTRFPPHLAWPTSACFILLVVSGTDRPFMFNPSIVPLLTALLYYSMVEMVRTGSLLAALLRGALLGLSSAAHVASMALAPIVVGVAFLSCTHRLGAAVAVGLAAAAVLLVDSPANFSSNLGVVQKSPGHVAATFVLALFFLGGLALLRQRFLGVPVDRRGIYLLALSGLCYPLLVGAASVTLGFPLDLGGRMVLPIMVPIAYLGGLATERLTRRLRAGGPGLARFAHAIPLAFLVLAFFVGWVSTPRSELLRPVFTLHEVSALARHLEASGRSVADVRCQLRGPGSSRAAYALRPWTQRQGGAPNYNGPDLRLLKLASGDLPLGGAPPDSETIELAFGKTLLLLPIESWVRAIPDRVCAEPSGGEFATSCLEETGEGRPDRPPLGERAANDYARLHLPAALNYGGESDSRVRFVFHLPVHIQAGDEERMLELVDLDEDWRIDRVEGVGFRGSLPARRVVITRNGSPTGHVVVSVAFSRWGFWHDDKSLDFVEVLETRPGEDFLRGLTEPPAP